MCAVFQNIIIFTSLITIHSRTTLGMSDDTIRQEIFYLPNCCSKSGQGSGLIIEDSYPVGHRDSHSLHAKKRVPRYAENYPDLRIGHRRLKNGHNQEKGTSRLVQHNSKSIFSRAPKFTLPKTRNNLQSKDTKEYIDKKALNELSNAQSKGTHLNKEEEILDLPEVTGLDQRDSDLPFDDPIKSSYERKGYDNERYSDSVTDKTNPTNVEEPDNWKNQDNFPKNDETTNFDGAPDRKIISLLNTLEQEIKHKQLGATEKQFINVKIKKIYEKIFSRHPESKRSEIDTPITFEDIRKFDEDRRRSAEIADRVIDENNEKNFFRDERFRKNNQLFTNNGQKSSFSRPKSHPTLESRVVNNYPHVSARFEDKVYEPEEFRDRNAPSEFDFAEDPLGNNRRQFYQEKIDSLKRRLRRVQKLHSQMHSKFDRRIHHSRPGSLVVTSRETFQPRERRFLET